ncbi:MAG: MFS transporter [Pseudonocardia sp.]|nr:MFS transporter [Pseudonocardia sp.]
MPPNARRTRPAGAVVAVATLAVGLGSVPGFLFGFLGPVLQPDLGISRVQLGALVGVFFGATGLGSTVGGALAERMGARRAVALDLVLVGGALLLAVLVPGYASLVVAAAISGAGYSLTNAGANMAVAASVDRARHGVAMAVKTAGVPMTAAVNSLVSVGVASVVGWRPVLAVLAPVMLLSAVVALWVLPEARSSGDPAAALREVDPADIGPAGHRRRAGRLPAGFGWFPAAAFLLVAGSQPLYSWVVPFLHEAGGVSLGIAGAVTSAGSVVAVVAMIGTARRSDRIGGTKLNRVVVLCAICAAGTLLLVLGTAMGPILTGRLVTGAGVIVATVAQLTAIGLMHAAVVAAAPHLVGRASGVTMSGYYLGALLGAPLFGLLVDVSGYGLAWTAGAAMVAGSALCFLRCRRVGTDR